MAAMGNSSTVITGHLSLSFFWLAATRFSRGARHREAPNRGTFWGPRPW